MHATGQVVAFSIENTNICPHQFTYILNKQLPSDVRILSSQSVNINFHPRHHAISRLYCYRIMKHQSILPLVHNVSIIRHGLSLNNLNKLATLFVGSHDFTAFCSSKDMNQNKIRTIYSAQFLEYNKVINFYIKGNAFLMKMVRRIVGTLIEPIPFEKNYLRIQKALHTKDKKYTGTTAIPNGLTLESVTYKKPHNADEKSYSS